MANRVENEPGKVNQTVISGGDKPQRRFKVNKKVLLIAVAVVFALGGISYAYSLLKKNQEKQSGVAVVCKEDILTQANAAFSASNLAQQGEVIKKIEKLKGYDRDPNCLLITTNYYVNAQDANNARIHYDKLVKVYKPESINKTLASNDKIYGLPKLQSDIEFRESKDRLLREGKLQGGYNGYNGQ